MIFDDLLRRAREADTPAAAAEVLIEVQAFWRQLEWLLCDVCFEITLGKPRHYVKAISEEDAKLIGHRQIEAWARYSSVPAEEREALLAPATQYRRKHDNAV